MANDRRSGPWNIHERFVDDVPMHQQKSAGRQYQRVKNVRNHKDGIEDDGEWKRQKNSGAPAPQVTVAPLAILRTPLNAKNFHRTYALIADNYKRGREVVMWHKVATAFAKTFNHGWTQMNTDGETG